MRKRILTILIAALAVLGIGLAAPSTASAGNGTANFYGTGHCGLNMGGGVWADLKFTNYDNGANQTIHTNITRSGKGVYFKIYVNGVYQSQNDIEQYISWPGHSKVVVGITAWVVGTSPTYTCSDSYYP